MGQGRSHALDGAAAQEAFDAVDRFGDDAAPAVGGELAAIALMLDPVALHFQAVADEGFRPVAGDGIRRIIVFIVQAENAVIRIGRFKQEAFGNASYYDLFHLHSPICSRSYFLLSSMMH